MKLLGNRVAVLLTPADKKIRGIIIPDAAQRPNAREGTAFAVGPDVKEPELILKQVVVFGEVSGTELEVDGLPIVIVRETEIHAVRLP